MTFETISIEMTRAEGAIQRLFGLIERRGFELRSFSMPEQNPSGCNDAFTVTVGIMPRDGTRCVDILSRQISRLHGIRRIDRAISGPARFPAPGAITQHADRPFVETAS